MSSKPCEVRRKKIDTGRRTQQLNRIYQRDRAICFHCWEHVPREDASREHLKPIRDFPELARDDDNVVLSHKGCNR